MMVWRQEAVCSVRAYGSETKQVVTSSDKGSINTVQVKSYRYLPSKLTENWESDVNIKTRAWMS